MLGREPAVIIATIAALLQAAWLFWSGDIEATATWAVPVATVLGGFLTRQKVIPTETVRDAGESPERIKADAENPTIPKYEGR